MNSTASLEANLRSSSQLICRASAAGAKYILTPEMTPLFGNDRIPGQTGIEPFENNRALRYYQALAEQENIWLHIGSLAVKGKKGMNLNRSVLFSPSGKIVCSYDKIHLFDVEVDGEPAYRESERFLGGDTAVVQQIPDARIGFSICYDLRFPKLYWALATAGANVITVPAAFTATTGEAHWEVLIRARAIETGAYVLAAAQTGEHPGGRLTYGHSLIVDPWGRIMADAGLDTGFILAEIDLDLVTQVREKLPALANHSDFSLSVNHDVAD